ncbi:hypothetical protein BMS3Bbin10_00831 [bacterium BMS3Bbin10]|nr:hypothetical protein BMS3Bbin10_00831 [bacterium BMS3Bbin10]
MNIEHERRQRPLHPRQRAFQHNEARAGHFRRGFEIHQAQRFAKLEMLLGRKAEGRLLSPVAHLNIVAFVLPLRHVIERRIGQGGERLTQRSIKAALIFLATLDHGLGPGHFVHQFLRRRLVAGGFRFADFLRRRIALRLRVLKFLNERAALLIEFEDRGRLGSEPALRQRGVKLFRVFANPFEIEHGGKGSD